MNRKQKKAKRLNATAHTKKQAAVYLTPVEEENLYEWKAHHIDEHELEEISEESQRFISIVKTVLYLMLFFPLAYVIWCNW